MRVGVLGGTFDPVHRGHLALARGALRVLGLDRVLLVPCRISPHKTRHPTAGVHRFAMLALAAAGDPGLVPSAIELERRGPSYTIDTLRTLERTLPKRSQLTLLLGTDSLGELTTWRAWREITNRCHLAAGRRSGFPPSEVLGTLPASLARRVHIGGERSTLRSARISILPFRIPPVSSTTVRGGFANGGSARGDVPKAVADDEVIGKGRQRGDVDDKKFLRLLFLCRLNGMANGRWNSRISLACYGVLRDEGRCGLLR